MFTPIALLSRFCSNWTAEQKATNVETAPDATSPSNEIKEESQK